MSDLVEMNLEDAVAALAHRDEYKYILWVFREERESLFKDLHKATDPNDILKIAGGIARVDQMLDLLTPPA